jgi:uncharacterized protein YidB (DUF937 family)
MARGAFPSLTALLGLLAVAGYQNRDKLGEMLGGGQRGGDGSPRPEPAGEDPRTAGLEWILGGAASGGGIGAVLGGGLRELADRFRQGGRGDDVDSWVSSGPNRDVSEHDLERVLGPDVMDDLTERTGLSRSELLARLTRELPGAVDGYTPGGRIPDDEDFGRA